MAKQIKGRMGCGLIELKLAQSDAGLMEFSGYGSTFDNIDDGGDVVVPGAFSKAIAGIKAGEKDWPAMLSQHGGFFGGDQIPVGVWAAISEDEKGLLLDGVLADTDRGIEYYKLMKMQPRPAIKSLSIGYYATKYSYGRQDGKEVRFLEEIDPIEISLVTRPMNRGASIDSVKSLAEMTERDFEHLMQDAGMSRKDARVVLNHGFKYLKGKQDAASCDFDGIAQLILKNSSIISN